MKIVLFDEIQEEHVVSSLYQSLKKLNIEVVRTGKLGQGIHPLLYWQDKILIENAINSIIESKVDVLFNFRPGSLDRNQLIRLKEVGILSIIWLSDDPVLYKTVYKDVIDLYDLVLHVGDQKVLQFYDSNHHKKGVVFPFWMSKDTFKQHYNPKESKYDYLFLGNVSGSVKKHRYEWLSCLTPDIIAFGKSENDHLNIFHGNLESIEEVNKKFQLGRIAINIPQFFKEYIGSEHFFPELLDLNYFILPSRVIQYAAYGFPIVTVGVKEKNQHFPEVISIEKANFVKDITADILNNNEELLKLSKKIRLRFNDSFTADVRAKYLLYLIDNLSTIQSSSLEKREFEYTLYNK